MTGRLQRRWGSPEGRGEALYFLSFNAANVLNYAYLVLMGFLLGEGSYGLFGALFGVVYLTGALANTVQVTVAKVVAEARAATGGRLPTSLMGALLARVTAVAMVAGLGALAVSPFLAHAFRTSLEPLVWVAGAIVVSVFVAALYGTLQGLQEFAWLGASVWSASAFRLGLGALLGLTGWGVTGALAAIVLGYVASGLVALPRVRARVQPERGLRPLGGLGSALAIVLAASIAVAFPTSFDVAVVKHYFPSQEASLFTAISILGRIVLFLPLALSLIAFPKVASARVRGDNPWPLLWATLAPVAVLSLASVLILLALVSFMGFSPADVDVGQALDALGWYLAAMALFSLVVVFVYHNLGRNNASYVFGLLLPCLLLQALLLISLHDSLAVVAQVVFASNALLLLVSFGHALAPLVTWHRTDKVFPARGRPLEAE